jgi:uncharacterized protein
VGREIYFPASLSAEGQPDAREEVEVGDIAYWPPGDAVCLFFGRTPANIDEKPRAASPVTVLDKIVGFGIFFLSRVPDARPDMTVDEYAPLVHGERTGTV